jgi:uncharacterized iron-regulated protein
MIRDRAPGGRWCGRLLWGLCSVLLAACAATGVPTPIAPGSIWSTRQEQFVPYDDLLRRVVAADVVFLGEMHDDPQHHANQLKILTDLIAAGKSPAVAMEQFDRSDQERLDRARREHPNDAQFASNAGGFNFKGWDWSMYGPIVDRTLAAGLPLIAANLSRQEASQIVRNGIETVGAERRAHLGLDRPFPGNAMRDLERAILDGHCGQLSQALVGRMADAQRLRDAVMSDAVMPYASRGVLVIAGRGHARRDFGAPFYISARDPKIDVVSVGMFELDARGRPMSEYGEASRGVGRGGAPVFDFLWFVPRVPRIDACENFPSRGLPRG